MAVELLVAIVQGILLASAFAFLALSLHMKALLRAVTAFAIGTALLAASFFFLASPFAGVLLLTVGAGLIAVLFLVAITLTGGREAVT